MLLLPYSGKHLSPALPSVGELEDNFGREGAVIPEHHIHGQPTCTEEEQRGFSSLWRGGGGGGGGGGTTIVG